MKKILFLSAAMALLAGCTSDELQQIDDSQYIKVDKVNISIEPLTPEDGYVTRTTMSRDIDGLWHYYWSENDVIGVFAIAPVSGGQVGEVLGVKESDDGTTATFDGGMWQLKKGGTYAAYYPFCPDMKLGDTYEDIPISMIGQTQMGNNSVSHMNAFSYMYAEPTVNETGTVNLAFKNAASILVLDLTFPEDAILNGIEVSAESDIFVTKAKLNAVDGTITSVATSKYIELGLKNVDVTGGQAAKFYISILPTTNTDKMALTVTATDANGTTYSAELREIKVKQGYSYDREATMTKSADKYDGKAYVDLGTGDGVLWARDNFTQEGFEDVVTNPKGGVYYGWYDLNPLAEYSWDGYYMYADGECQLCCPNDGISVMRLGEEEYGNEIDDVAYLYGEPASSWRIPSPAEMQNLIDKCNWTWTEMNGVNGYRISSRSVPSRWIFLPANGSVSGTNLSEYNSVGYYWTSTLDTNSNGWMKGKCLKFTNSSSTITSVERFVGMSIRPVYIGTVE